MPRKWTREERRKHIQEKYTPWKTKIFVLVIFLVFIFLLLSLALTGTLAEFSLQVNSAFLLGLIVVLFFMVVYKAPRAATALIAAIIILLLLFTVFLLLGPLSGIVGFIASVVIGLLFLLLIAVAAFFIDMVFFESW